MDSHPRSLFRSYACFSIKWRTHPNKFAVRADSVFEVISLHSRLLNIPFCAIAHVGVMCAVMCKQC